MTTTMERLVDVNEMEERMDVVELGEVSEETKGSPMGSWHDGGYGARL
jgi:hypothetical protein